LNPGTHVREPRTRYHNGGMRKPARERRTGPSPSADGVVRFRRQAWDRVVGAPSPGAPTE
jgi:hypothetical protein